PGEFFSIADLVTPGSTRTLATLMKARALWYLGRGDEARALMNGELVHGDTLPISRLHVFGVLAQIEAWSGSLSLAERYAAQARRVARLALTADHPYLVAAELAQAHVLTERDHADRTVAALDRVERLGSSVAFDAWAMCEVFERAWQVFVAGAPRR